MMTVELHSAATVDGQPRAGWTALDLSQAQVIDGRETKRQGSLSPKFCLGSGFLVRHTQQQGGLLSMEMCSMVEMRFVHRSLGADPWGLVTCTWHPDLLP